jgi:hypothetical protein
MNHLTPCNCEECKKGNHCHYCTQGNPGSHFLFQTGKPVPSWFPTCFPEYRHKNGKVILPEKFNDRA